MPSKAQQTGMRGVYLVAAEMVARGLVVSPTSRSAFGADLLATNESCSRAYSVQVKTNAKPAKFWLLGEKAQHLSAPSHFYVLVNLHTRDQAHEYYVVPSRVIADKMRVERRPNSTWYAFYKNDGEQYRDRWDQLGSDGGAA